MSVYNSTLICIIEDFEKRGLVLWILILGELSVCKEVFTVDAMVVLVLESQSAEIDCGLSGQDAATETWLTLIQWDQVDSRVGEKPETTKHALHVATCDPKRESRMVRH